MGSHHPIAAKELMIFPCVAPHYHPYPYQRAQELLRINLAVPLHERKKIIYLTRRVCCYPSIYPLLNTANLPLFPPPLSTMKSNSRRVINEDAVIQKIEEFLKENNRPEELLIYESGNYPELDDNIRLFNYEARYCIVMTLSCTT